MWQWRISRRLQPRMHRLHVACFSENLQKVREICTSPTRRHEISLFDRGKMSPLHLAVSTGNVEIVEYLLEQPGLDIRAQMIGGETALSLSCRIQFVPLKIVALLIAKAPDVVHWLDRRSFSPMQKALASGRPDIMRILIEQGGVDPNQEDINGCHILFYAVSNFDMETIHFLKRETNCDMTHRNNNGQTAFETICTSLQQMDCRENFIIKMFHYTYPEFTTPKVLGRLLRECGMGKRGIGSGFDMFSKRTLISFDCLKLAILEKFYLSPRNNPEHYELVTRLLAVDLHSESIRKSEEIFWLCLPLQNKDVLDEFDIQIFVRSKLEIMFRLFIYEHEIFEEYLPRITQTLSYDRPQSVFYTFRAHAKHPSTSGRLIEFFKRVCLLGFNLDVLLDDNRLFLERTKFMYALQPTARPFIRYPDAQDALICRYFLETDSGNDVKRYASFQQHFNEGFGFNEIPTLFNLCRTVVRQTVFHAENSSSKKLFNLNTLDIPITVKNRLLYLAL